MANSAFQLIRRLSRLRNKGHAFQQGRPLCTFVQLTTGVARKTHSLPLSRPAQIGGHLPLQQSKSERLSVAVDVSSPVKGGLHCPLLAESWLNFARIPLGRGGIMKAVRCRRHSSYGYRPCRPCHFGGISQFARGQTRDLSAAESAKQRFAGRQWAKWRP